MPAFVIFVEGADTEPAKLPVYIVESEEHASLICEGMKESDYHIFDFSFKHCTRSDRGKFAVWATMICDAREGVYGNIVGGIHKMIDGAYSIMSGRRSREKIASGADTETGNGGPEKSTNGTGEIREPVTLDQVVTFYDDAEWSPFIPKLKWRNILRESKRTLSSSTFRRRVESLRNFGDNVREQPGTNNLSIRLSTLTDEQRVRLSEVTKKSHQK